MTYVSAPYSGQRSHAYRFYSVGRDNAGNVESAPAVADTATVVSSGPNTAPVIASIANRVAVVGQPLAFSVAATDSDVPANTLTFTLDTGAPAGAGIDAATGLFTWTPTAAQAPGTYPVTVRVTDNGTPPLSATRSFSVTVRTNQPPVAGPDSAGTTLGRPVSISAAKLLLNDYDPDGDALTLAILNPASSHGGTVALASGIVTYAPPAGL